MSDPISITAALLEIGDKILGGGRWLWRKLQWSRAPARIDEGPLSFEVKPVGFTIDLTSDIPNVEIRFHAINYLKRPLSLIDIHVTRLSLPDACAIDGIRLAPALEGIVIAERRSVMIHCAKILADSQARAIHKLPTCPSASISFTARGKDKRREYQYGPVSAIAIEGRTNRRQK